MNPCDLERAIVVERRQDPGQPPREHGLPDPGWPGEQEVVASRRGDLEHPARAFLAAYVRELGERRRAILDAVLVPLERRTRRALVQVVDGFAAQTRR